MESALILQQEGLLDMNIPLTNSDFTKKMMGPKCVQVFAHFFSACPPHLFIKILDA